MLLAPKNKIKRSLITATIGAALICLSQLCTDEFINFFVTKLMRFGPNSIIYNIWKDPPYDLFMKIYVFNATNPEEFLSGTDDKIKFQELGPYTYREEMIHLNPRFNDNGTITFQLRRTLEFIPEKSVGDAKIDVFTSPNIPLLGVTSTISDFSIFTQMGFASVANVLGAEPFRNLTIDEYLFGYDDPLVSAANTFIPNWIDFPRFGVLDRIMALDNASDAVTLNNLREDEDENLDSRRYAINRWNGSPGLSQWGYGSERNSNFNNDTTCDKVEGTFMGTIFPPNIPTDASFRVYRHAFCRVVPLQHTANVTTKDGFEAFLYRTTSDFLSRAEENPDNICYCNTQNCLPNGLTDISPCYYGIPITLSKPHFYNADSSVINQFEGMHPNKEKHDLTLTVHPKVGAVLDAKLRIQINLHMRKTYYNPKTEPFNDLIIPLFWAELTIDDVPSNIYFYLKLLSDILPILQLVFMYLFAISGGCLLFGSAITVVIFPSNSNNSKNLNINYSQVPIMRRKSSLIPLQILIKK